jgi:chromosome segregation ATPase
VSAKIDEAKAASEAIRSDIAVLNTRLDRIKAAREAEEAKQNELRQAQQEARADIPALNVEKKELWEVRSVVMQGQGWLAVEKASAH